MNKALQLRYSHDDHTRVIQDMQRERVSDFNFGNN